MAAADDRRSYLGLDLVRFFAALSVTVFHLGFATWQYHHTTYAAALSPIASIASVGWVGVPIFFVLSGFVIAMSATDKATSKFVRSRVLRLYPAAWICAAVSLGVLAASGGPASLEQAINSFILSPTGPWVSGVYWTLGVEIVFYAVVAIMHCWLGNRAIPILATSLTASSALYLGARLLDSFLGGQFRDSLLFFESPSGKVLLLGSAAYFAVGMNLWALLQRPTVFRALALAASTFLALVTVVANSRNVSSIYPEQSWYAAPLLWLACLAAIGASIHWSSRVSKVVGTWKIQIRTVGLMTYPLYLVHDIVGYHCSLIFHSAFPSVVFGIICSIVVAHVVVKIEPHVRNILSNVLCARHQSGVTPELSGPKVSPFRSRLPHPGRLNKFRSVGVVAVVADQDHGFRDRKERPTEAGPVGRLS
jgi:exopolysaccharide production protein ExoZ